MLRNTLRLPCVLQFSLQTHETRGKRGGSEGQWQREAVAARGGGSEAVPARRWQREAVWRWQRGAVAARGGGSEGRWQRDGGS